MNAFGFTADLKLTDFLKKHSFTLSAEIIPPRNGVEQVQVLGQIEALVGAGAQFLAVTKGAGGSLRGGSLPIAQAIKERFKVPAIAHFTCRDLTPQEVENQLMDHHYFGIRNILALRGDPPDGATQYTPRDGGYSYAHQLISQIRNLNHGIYLKREGGPQASEDRETTDFCIGAAVYPDHPHPDERISFFEAKVRAGAEFGITDMLYDVDSYARFLEALDKRGLRIPILPGTRILKSQKQAERMRTKFKCNIPESILQSLPAEVSAQNEAEALKRGTEVFLKMVERLKTLGAPGIHLFVIVDTQAGVAAIKSLLGNSC